MKKRLLLMSAMVAMMMSMQAQTAYKVDINESSRNNMDEVLEPGFTPWRFTNNAGEGILEMDDGVTFTLRSEQTLYNLNGQRITTPSQGIYIKNGKKVIVK